MIGYGKDVNTGKFHKIDMISWTDGKFDPTPLESIPVGALYGGLFEIRDGVIHFLSDNILDFKDKKPKK